MPGRFTDQFPQGIARGEFTPETGSALARWAESADDAVNGLQGTPDSPTQIQAGVEASEGDSQAAATSNHAHDVLTAAPSLVLISGSPDEGTGAALLRADATFVLDASTLAAGEVLGKVGSTFAGIAVIVTKEYVFLAPGGAVDVMVWRAPYACEVQRVSSYQTGGTPGTVNARKNGASEHLAADLATAAGAYTTSVTIQNGTYAAGDRLEMRVKTVAGAPAQIVIQVDLRRT